MVDLSLNQEGVTRGVATATPVALRFYPLGPIKALRREDRRNI